jgi:hypothetical protein
MGAPITLIPLERITGFTEIPFFRMPTVPHISRLPVYELAIREIPSEGSAARTSTVLRWAVGPSASFCVVNPRVRVVAPEQLPVGVGGTVNRLLKILCSANARGTLRENHSEDFFPTIPSMSSGSRVFFGGAKPS